MIKLPILSFWGFDFNFLLFSAYKRYYIHTIGIYIPIVI